MSGFYNIAQIKEIIIILGSPNSPEGILGDIALARLTCCLEIFDSNKNLILCTGGFGEHFNTAPRPHAAYLIDYLVSRGINKSSFLEMALSSNTVDDAVKAKEIVMKNPLPCRIITSDYHLERAKIIFDQVLPEIRKEYQGVKHKCSKADMSKLLEHERKAISGIIKNGLYF